jgi:hypothetical protein
MPEETLVALRLSKEGFGRPDEILAMPVDLVIDALTYSQFLVEYSETHYALNKPDQ